MRALRFDRYGPPDVLRIDDVPEPTPDAGEAKVRVAAVGLNPLDWKIRAGHLRFLPLFRSPPRGVGCDFAGEIVAVGGGATPRHVGERVCGTLRPFSRQGALADFIVAPYSQVLPLPADVDDVQAAALPIAGSTALQALVDDAGLRAGQNVLITGAAGGVGHFAVQIAKQVGARVVGVCSAGNAEFVRSLGADEVIDYAKDDFTSREDRFDAVFDAAGVSSFAASRRVLTETGCYINTCGNTAAALGTVASALMARVATRQRAIPLAIRNSESKLRSLIDRVRNGTLHAHVERTLALDDVAAAQADMETGHGRGKIVVKL